MGANPRTSVRRALSWAPVAAIVAAMGLWMWFEGSGTQIHEQISRAKVDMRRLATAVESLAIDYCGSGRPAVQRIEDDNPATPLWALREVAPVFSNGYPSLPDEPTSITTPIAYLAAVPRDPFTGELYGYWTKMADHMGTGRMGPSSHHYLMSSAGPDRDHDLDLREAYHQMADVGDAWLESRSGRSLSLEEQRELAPLPPPVLNGLYDATNGLRSDGDLLWVSFDLERVTVNEQTGFRWHR